MAVFTGSAAAPTAVGAHAYVSVRSERLVVVENLQLSGVMAARASTESADICVTGVHLTNDPRLESNTVPGAMQPRAMIVYESRCQSGF